MLAGDHICAFYRGRSERDNLVVPFLRDGVRAGQPCICVVDASEHDGIRDALDGDVDGLVMEGFEETYLRSGSFRGPEMLAYWQHRHFARGVTDLSWAQPQLSAARLELDDLVAYEVEVTGFTRSCRQVALCLYDLDLFGGDVIIPVMKAHPKVRFNGMVLENLYPTEGTCRTV